MFDANSTQPSLTAERPAARTQSVTAATAAPGEIGANSAAVAATAYAPSATTAQRLSAITRTPSHIAPSGNIAVFLTAQARGDAVAWEDDEIVASYANLRFAVGVMSERLRALDVAPGSPVALLAANGVFWMASYLAILASGHVAVPLPTALGADEIVARATWAGCRAILVDRSQKAKTSEAAGIPVVDEQGSPVEWAAGEAAAIDAVDVAPHDDAAYLFTSGTTGAPRAVRITHDNIRANTESILAYLDLTPEDRMLVVLPFTYVFGASLLHTHLRAGASLVGHRSSAFPETIVRALADHRCTGMAGVPSVYNVLVRNSTFTQRQLPDLRIIQQAGGALSPAVLAELVEGQPQARLFVMYGQTEATARLSYLPPSELLRRPGSIGRGIPGVHLRVVDARGDDIAPGGVGEIVATGRSISPGYVGDPDATRRKMPHGVLHTGDLATVDEDGFIYIRDRAEDFIKSWGHRVASGDVEAVAMELPGVVAAAAVGVPDERAGERVELVVVTRSGSELAAREVIRHCRRRLAPHMVPTRVHLVDALPVNANGKVVKRFVRELCIDAPAAGAGEGIGS